MKDLSSFGLSFWSGLQGGVIGGAGAAIPIVVGYHRMNPLLPLLLHRAAEVFLYTVLVGAVMGMSAQFGMALFRWLTEHGRWPVWLVNDITGATLAGALGGALIGLVGGAWFVVRDDPAIDISLVFVAALIGAALIGAAVILYDTGGQLGRMIIYCLLPLPFSGALAVLAFCMFQINLDSNGLWEALFKGAKLGLAAGLPMGLQIGLGLFLYRRRTWPQEDSLRAINPTPG